MTEWKTWCKSERHTLCFPSLVSKNKNKKMESCQGSASLGPALSSHISCHCALSPLFESRLTQKQQIDDVFARTFVSKVHTPFSVVLPITMSSPAAVPSPGTTGYLYNLLHLVSSVVHVQPENNLVVQVSFTLIPYSRLLLIFK